MKKYILSILSILVSVSISAAVTKAVNITLDDGVYFHNFAIVEASNYDAGVADCSPMFNVNSNPIALYYEYGGTAYEIVQKQDLTNLSLVMKTNSSTNLALYFASITGDVVLYDAVLDSVIHIDEITPYEFTIPTSQRNSTISDRFVICYQAAPAGPSVFGICYRGGKITVDNPEDNAMTVRIFDNATGTQVGSDETVAAHSTQDITPTLTAGELYKVEVYYQGAIYTESDSQQHHRIIRAE